MPNGGNHEEGVEKGVNVLIAAPAGYVGRRLLRRLGQDDQLRLPVLVRDARRIREELYPQVEVVETDRLDRAALSRTVRDIDVAYFPIRFFSGERDFGSRSREFAALFRDCCIEAGELILIVEDNEKNRKLVRDVLNVKGYKTIETETAEEGLNLAVEKQPALILMDIQLPGIDGITALKRLRADPRTKTIPVIAITASAMTYNRLTTVAEGFDAFKVSPLA